LIAHMEAPGHGILVAIDSDQNGGINIVKIVREQGIVEERPWETSRLDDSEVLRGIRTLPRGVERDVLANSLSYELADDLLRK
jgi:hypothetical protein